MLRETGASGVTGTEPASDRVWRGRPERRDTALRPWAISNRTLRPGQADSKPRPSPSAYARGVPARRPGGDRDGVAGKGGAAGTAKRGVGSSAPHGAPSRGVREADRAASARGGRGDGERATPVPAGRPATRSALRRAAVNRRPAFGPTPTGRGRGVRSGRDQRSAGPTPWVRRGARVASPSGGRATPPGKASERLDDSVPVVGGHAPARRRHLPGPEPAPWQRPRRAPSGHLLVLELSLSRGATVATCAQGPRPLGRGHAPAGEGLRLCARRSRGRPPGPPHTPAPLRACGCVFQPSVPPGPAPGCPGPTCRGLLTLTRRQAAGWSGVHAP
jgi:hypothetical protein